MHDETPDSPQAPPDSPRRKLRLDQFLKLTGLADTGGQAKVRVQWGDVKVNGEVCTARGRGLKPGDRVELDGQEVVVEESLWEQTEEG